MAPYLVKNNKFFTAEENGKIVKLTVGYTGGTAITRTNLIEITLIRKMFIVDQYRQFRKNGYRKAAASFQPKTTAEIDLLEYQLANNRYFENAETDRFFEIAIHGDELAVREGAIGGLGTVKRYIKGKDTEDLDRLFSDLIDEKKADGYTVKIHGETFSLDVVSAELSGKKIDTGTSD